MKKEQIKGSAMLLFATLIWGCAFVAQSVGRDHLGPMSFQAIRSALAVASVLVAAYVGVMTLFWGNISFTIVLCGLILLPIWVAYGWRYFRVFR